MTKRSTYLQKLESSLIFGIPVLGILVSQWIIPLFTLKFHICVFFHFTIEDNDNLCIACLSTLLLKLITSSAYKPQVKSNFKLITLIILAINLKMCICSINGQLPTV